MSGMDKVEARKEDAVSFQEVADKIGSNPDRWVLFIGNGVSIAERGEREQILSNLAIQVCKAAPADPGAAAAAAVTAAKIRQAVQANDFAQLSGALFGSTWDGASFLERDRQRNIRLRKEYAKHLRGRDEIDVFKAGDNPCLRELIGAFRGIILTTRQDDMVEALWEYENSLPADTIVHTPQLIAASNGWSQWLHAADWEAAYRRFQNESLANSVVLAKLFGSRDKPNGMLFSGQDLEEFYPPEEKRTNGRGREWEVNTILFLEKIFASRSILFIGVDGDWLLETAEGILDLLRKKLPPNVERYALWSKGFDAGQYHARTIDGKPASVCEGFQELAGRLRKLWAANEGETTETGEEALLQAEKILDLFWQSYSRRPQRLFMQGDRPNAPDGVYDAYSMEYAVLKKDIFGIPAQGGGGGGSREWSRKSVRQLAIAANNFSDFYDLRDAMELEKTEQGEAYETRISRLLSSRFSNKSLLLYRILRRYESGFPFGFLQLLPKEEYGLKSWRRAGIQLANSGVYVQRHGKQRLYERLRYADHVMKTAGRSPFQTRICNEINALGSRSMYSYLYPFHDVEIAGSDSIDPQVIDEHFIKMFRTLYGILRDKSEEHQQIYSLLQTELPAIVKMMRTLPDERLEWKPGLLYYLLLESRVCKDETGLLEYCDKLEWEREKLGRRDAEEPEWRLFYEGLLLRQAKALIMSQSFDKEKQQAAADECQAVENAVFQGSSGETCWSGEIPSEIFKHGIRACFLRGTILGRMSTLYEIERCEAEKEECDKQRLLLEKMKSSLDSAQKIIKKRESALGERYKELRSELARLMGEYHFKMSQYYHENRRFSGKGSWDDEKDCYEKAEIEYTNALNYYNRSPDRYWIQCADTLRSMGDMYCQWMRSVNTMEGPSGEKRRKELTEKCYDNLIKAYTLYRSHSDLHGIADILQSMGQVEGYIKEKEADKLRRSFLCYYKASADLYKHLGDAWNYRVVCSFLEGEINERKKLERIADLFCRRKTELSSEKFSSRKK